VVVLFSFQIPYQPSEFEYQYHLAEGCAVDGKVFASKQHNTSLLCITAASFVLTFIRNYLVFTLLSLCYLCKIFVAL